MRSSCSTWPISRFAGDSPATRARSRASREVREIGRVDRVVQVEQVEVIDAIELLDVANLALRGGFARNTRPIPR